MNFHLTRNIVASVAGFTANVLLLIFSYRLLVQQGGLAMIGLWSSLMAWIFLIRLGDVGMTNGVIRFAAACNLEEESDRIRGYVDTALVMNAILFALLSFAGWAAMDINIGHMLPESSRSAVSVRPLLPLLLVTFYLQNLSGLIMGALQAIHRGYISSLLMLAGTLIQLVLAISLIPSLGLAGLALAQISQYFIMLVVGWQLFRVALAQASRQPLPLLPEQASWSIAREMISFSIKAQFANLLNGLFEPLAKLLIGHSAGLHVLGLFEIAYKTVILPRNAIVTGVMATIPAKTRLFVSDPATFRELHRKSNLVVILAATIVLGGVTLVTPFVMPLWLGHPEPLLSIFVATLAVGFWLSAVSSSAYALGISSGVMRTNIEASFVALGVLLLLNIPAGQLRLVWLNVIGVSVATAASSAWVLWRTTRSGRANGASEILVG